MTDPNETLLFETSPYGNLDAIVEHDQRVVYFYLNGQSESGAEDRFGVRACWVRNLVRGPLAINRDDMTQGKPPLLPRTDCLPSEPGVLPNPDQLQIVWFEEGNGAALIEHATDGASSRTLAVIPPWSGVDGFHGYAADCAHETSLCWPMPDNERLDLRIQRSLEFWNSFSQQGTPFQDLQPQQLEIYQQKFAPGAEPRYFAIDGGKFPQRGLVRFDLESEIVVLTVGMSMCPQPATELFVDSPSDFRRVELGARLPKDLSEEAIDDAMKSISSYAGYPWKSWTWFGPGHTLQWRGANATLVRDEELQLPSFRDDPVHLLWIG